VCSHNVPPLYENKFIYFQQTLGFEFIFYPRKVPQGPNAFIYKPPGAHGAGGVGWQQRGEDDRSRGEYVCDNRGIGEEWE
jgi:hypothetical protein